MIKEYIDSSMSESCRGRIDVSGRTGTSSDQMERREESRRNEVRDETARFGIIRPLDRLKRETECMGRGT